jgi:hypothetical protein
VSSLRGDRGKRWKCAELRTIRPDLTSIVPLFRPAAVMERAFRINHPDFLVGIFSLHRHLIG